MKNKLNRNSSSDDETTTTTTIIANNNSNTNETSSKSKSTRKTPTYPSMMPNLRKFGGINRIVEPTVNPNRIEKFLEQMDLFAVDSVVKIESSYRAPLTSIETVLSGGNYEQLNPEKSLVDQIISIRVDHAANESTVEQTGPSKIDIQLQPRRHVTKRETSTVFKPLNETATTTKPNMIISPLYQHLAQLGTQLVPVDAFEHTINTNETKAIKLELEYSDSGYWPVKVRKCETNSSLYQLKLVNETTTTTTTSNLSRVDSDGLDLSKASNWSSTTATNHRVKWFFHNLSRQRHLKPLGWGKENNRVLKRPPDNLNLDALLDQLVDDSDENNKITHDDKQNVTTFQFQVNSKCELFDDETNEIRPAVVKRNVNGRLLLEVTGDSSRHKWCFYTDARLNYKGGGNGGGGGGGGGGKTMEIEIDDGVAHPNHHRSNFTTGTYLECLYMSQFYAARVIDSAQNNLYFHVEITSHDSNNAKVLTFFYQSGGSFPTLFPCNWCASNNLWIHVPNEWPLDKPFDWREFERVIVERSQSNLYFTQIGDIPSLFNWSRCSLVAEKFPIGAYLECVDPRDETVICLGQIKARVEHLIFVSLVYDGNVSPKQLFVFSVDSTDLFPLGWSEMNCYYELREDLYKKYFDFEHSRLEVERYLQTKPITLTPVSSIRPQNWSNRIYLNTKVNCGPYLKKSKLDWLPKCFGPGPLVLVLQKLIQMIINVSEKPFKLLKLFQTSRYNLHRSKPSNLNLFLDKSDLFHRIRIKAKEKGKFQFRDIEICTQLSQLSAFLNEICIRLKCCFRMISTIEPSQLIEKDEYYAQNSRLCIDIKCCLVCSLNYFSKPNLTNTIEDEPPKTRSHSDGNNKKLPISKNLKPKLIENHITTKPIEKIKKIKKNINLSSSPIRTRFNLRLTHSMMKMSPSSSSIKEIKEKKSDDKTSKKPIKIKSEIVDGGIINSNKYNHQVTSEIAPASTNLHHIFSPPPPPLQNFINPMNWGSKDVCKYLLENKFDPNLVYLIEEHEIDGQSFLMLNLPTIQSYMNLKLGPALKLAHLVEKLKITYFQQQQQQQLQQNNF